MSNTIYKGEKFTVQWDIKDSVTALPFDFSNMFLNVILYSDNYKGRVTDYRREGNKLSINVNSASLPCGNFSIKLEYSNSVDRAETTCKKVFQLTRNAHFASDCRVITIQSYAPPLKLENMTTNYLGIFPNEQLLMGQTYPAWALVGDLTNLHPYAYYTQTEYPPGLHPGWNDISDILGTYNILASINEQTGPIDINNLPDEEDLTATGGETSVLKLKDREVSEYEAVSHGRKILRRNWVQDKNVLTQHMVENPNMTYVVQYDFDLNGETITMPEGCELEFQGGSITNGVIIGNETKLSSAIKLIFSNITINGTWKTDKVYPEWFGAVGKESVDDTIPLQQAIDFSSEIRSDLILSNNEYYSHQLVIKPHTHLLGSGWGKSILQYLDNDGVFILFSSYACGVIIKDLTLNGGKESSFSDMSRSSIGLSIPKSDQDEWQGSFENNAPMFDKSAREIQGNSYKNTLLKNLFISNFSTGISVLGGNFTLFADTIRLFYNNNCGLRDDSTDNNYSNLYIEYSGNNGIVIYGSNNRYSNLKVIFSGSKSKEPVNGDITLLGSGISILGKRNMIINSEFQDNSGNNLMISGQSNRVENCIFDTMYAIWGSVYPAHLSLSSSAYGNYVTGIASNYGYGGDDARKNKNPQFYTVHGRLNVLKDNYTDIKEERVLDANQIFRNKQTHLNNYSDSIACRRNTSVDVGGTTFPAHKAVIINDGLHKQADEDIYFSTKPQTLSTNIGIITEFVYNSDSSSASILSSDKLSISCGTGVGITISMAPNLTVSTSLLSNYTFENGKTYRLCIICGRTSNSHLPSIYVTVSYLDDNGRTQTESDTYSFYYYYDRADVYSCFMKATGREAIVYKSFIFTNDISSIDKNARMIGTDLSMFRYNSNIYIDFVGYRVQNQDYLNVLPSVDYYAFGDRVYVYDGNTPEEFVCSFDNVTKQKKFVLTNAAITIAQQYQINGLKQKDYVVGYTYYDKDKGYPLIWNGKYFVNTLGYGEHLSKKGTTAERPNGGVPFGFEYYDTTLAKWIKWNGASWDIIS